MTEREFLIFLAIQQYNYQYNMSLSVAGCDVRSIVPGIGSELGYEVTTVRLDDFVRLRIYLNIEDRDQLAPYTLDNSEGTATAKLGDEVFVAYGKVDRNHIYDDNYKFRWLGNDLSRLKILMTEDDTPLITEDGDYILLEDGV